MICSYLFYAAWDVRFIFLILFTTLSDFFLAKKIYCEKPLNQKWLLSISISIDLGILCVFKYYNFFIGSFIQFANVIGLGISYQLVNTVLPVGISFYTFQSLSYTIDVYRSEIKPENSFLNYALFLSFFPQLVAGPIVKAKELLPQFKIKPIKTISEIPLKLSLYYILLGYIKKSVIADNIAIISDIVFANSTIVSWSFVLLGVIAYSIQIYCDFSGYSDIAVGVAFLLGFQLPENFRLPYMATSFRDFWNRWHISLSSWLREYLYISLGGNHRGEFRTYRNLLFTMLLGGLWHGANWTFIFWGGMHGLFLTIERSFMNISTTLNVHNCFLNLVGERSRTILLILSKLFRVLYAVFVVCMVCLLWVFFRAENFQVAYSLFSGLFDRRVGVDCNYFLSMRLFYVIFFMVIAHLLGWCYGDSIEKVLGKRFTWYNGLLFAIVIMVAVLLSGDTKPFIYFVF